MASLRVLILGGTDFSLPGPSSDSISQDGRAANALVRGLQRRLVSGDKNLPHISALYFAPSAGCEDAPRLGTTSSILDGGFHLQPMAARGIPIPGLDSDDPDSQPARIPYLLLHQHLEIDRICRKVSLQAHQRDRTHTVIHANTAGPFGINMRRIANRRSFPFMASYHGTFCDAVEASAVALISAARDQTRPLDQALTQDLFREIFPFLADEPRLLGPISEIFADAKTAQKHLLNRHHRLVRRAGRILFWIGQRLNSYVYDKVEGGKAVARIYQNVNQLGDDLSRRYEIDKALEAHRPDSAILRTVRMLIERYLQWFYRGCHQILITDEKDRGRLLEIGVDEERVRLVQPESNELIESIYFRCSTADRLRSEETAQKPHVQSLRDFQWKRRDAASPRFQPFCTISDLHLADGDSFDRMEALAELYPLLDAQGVHSIVYNGDLGELSASQKKYQAHRDRVNWVRQTYLKNVPEGGVPPIASALVRIADLPDLNGKSSPREKVIRQMTKAAGRAGLSLHINGNHIGILASENELQQTDQSSIGRVQMDEVLLYGNHDEGLDLEQEFPGIRSASSLIHFDAEMGAVFTHGHIVGLPEFLAAMQDCDDPGAIADRLRKEKLADALEMQEVIHDIATMGWRFTERAINSRWLWKHALQPAISRTVRQLRRRRLQADELSEEDAGRARFWESIVSPADDVQRCGELAASFHTVATPTWICCYGHSHVPAIEKLRVRHPRTGSLHTKLVVNSGKFHGDLITATIVNFPEVTIFYWSHRDKEWRLHMYDCLSKDEIAEVLDVEGVQPARIATPKAPETASDQGTVLHEVPTEGDGHITRFAALFPEYQKHGTVCTVLSGPRSQQIDLPGGVHHRCRGLRLLYDELGGLDPVASTAAYFRQIQRVGEEAKGLAEIVPNFQVLVSDFGPTLKLAHKEAQRLAKAQHRLNSLPELFGVSHQAALESQQTNVPRPDISFSHDVQQRAIEMLRGTKSIGFHYEQYNDNILLPMIRPEVRSLEPKFDGDFVLVYLRGDAEVIVRLLAEINLPVRWRVYHRETKAPAHPSDRIEFRPTSRDAFTADLVHCRGILADAGFGITSEALHLGLPLVARPVPNQYEQQSNAAALKRISDVGIVEDLHCSESAATIHGTFAPCLNGMQRLERSGCVGPIAPFPNVEQMVVQRILDG